MPRLTPFAVRLSATLVALALSLDCAQAFRGANVPWTTYEAEAMTNNGTVLGPDYTHNTVASESSGRQCVQLSATGQYMEFTARAAANAMVVRYNVPDSADGKGTDSTISLYTNGIFSQKLPVTSKYTWLYGAYQFTNSPAAGSPRNFYDEVRVKGLSINAGDAVRLQKDADDSATNYVIDLVELENVAPLTAPANSLSITNYGATGSDTNDDTTALTNCIAVAKAQGKTVWLPPGSYRITRSINLPNNANIQGAGMWYTTLVGDPTLYITSSRRITLNGNGNNIHLADLAIIGKLNYRNDSEPNDGLGGAFGTNSTISRLWVEHTKTGAWLVNSLGLVVDSCRFRDTIADGINLNLGMRGTIVTNCTARGTGDDCFAMWPATYLASVYKAGLNVFTHCTGQLPFLANGASIDGGESNRVEDSLFKDYTYGCGILFSTTFAVASTNLLTSGVAQRCDLVRCGGYDPNGWGWRAAVQVALDHKSVTGININNLNIFDSMSDGLSIVAPGSNITNGLGTLSNAIIDSVNIPDYGLGTSGRHGLWVRNDGLGSMTVSNSVVVESQNDSANFSVNATSPALPALAIATTVSNTAVVSWPAFFPAFSLRTNSDLTTSNWQSASYPVVSNAWVSSVTVPLPVGSLFLRLQNP